MDVEGAILILGQPEDYQLGDDADDSSADYLSNDEGFRARKRIFRNPDDKVIGGVAGGLAAYFNIDAVWIRLIFVILFFTPFSGLLIYIILWIVMPEAKTTADKLQMRGEKINLSTIERSVQEEMRRAGKAFQESAEESTQSGSERAKAFLQDVIEFSVNLIRLIFMGIWKVLSVLAIGIGLLLLIVLVSSLFWGTVTINGTTYDSWTGLDALRFFFPDVSDYRGILWGLGLLLLPTMIYAIMAMVRVMFKLPKFNPMIGRSALIISVLGLFVTIFSSMYFGSKFSSSAEENTRFMLEHRDSPHFVQSEDPVDSLETIFDLDVNNKRRYFYADGDIRYFGLVEMDIQPTGEEYAYLEIEKSSRGRGSRDARELAAKAVYQPRENDSVLVIPTYYSLINETPFRGQFVEVTLRLPVGHSVYLDKSLDGTIYDIDNVSHTHDYAMLGHTWMMTERGLDCLDCDGREYGKSDPWDELDDIPEKE
jgi:phage shock protein PspC (stress-responsive transcriptional regulator)